MVNDGREIRIGSRVLFTVPERGGAGYGFGDVVKCNRKSVHVIDRKFPGEQRVLVDVTLIYEVR